MDSPSLPGKIHGNEAGLLAVPIGIGLLVAGVNCLTGETGDGTWEELSPDNIW